MTVKNSDSKANQERLCLNCGKLLASKRSGAKFCSDSCKSKHHYQKNQENIANPAQKNKGYSTPGLISITSKNQKNKEQEIKDIEALKTNSLEKRNMAIEQKKAKTQEIQDLSVDTNGLVTLAGLLGGGLVARMASENIIVAAGGAVLGGAIAKSFIREIPPEEQIKTHNRIFLLTNEIPDIDRTIRNCNKEISDYNVQLFILKYSNGNSGLAKVSETKKIPEKIESTNGIKHQNDSKTSEDDRLNKKVLNSQDFLKIDYPEFSFSGVWFDLFGDPATNFFNAIHGKPGSGKSTLALQFANYLAINFGLVIYISGEEGHSKTIQDKVKRLDIKTKNLFIADLRTIEEIKAELKKNKYHFIFIDSLDTLRMGPEEMKELRQMLPNNAFITISQSTKDGKMRGSNELIHDCDVVIQVESGIATTTKNRFKESGKVHEIF